MVLLKEKSMKQKNDADRRLSEVLTHFLEQKCVMGMQYAIDDNTLFLSFREFWSQSSEHMDHPALLGQFRVELVQRGYQAKAGGKYPRWSGLTLRTQSQEPLNK